MKDYHGACLPRNIQQIYIEIKLYYKEKEHALEAKEVS